MATEWIKARANLAKSRKLAKMSRWIAEQEQFRKWWSANGLTSDPRDALLIVRKLLVAELLSVWSAANGIVIQDRLTDTEIDDLDALGEIPLIGRAMAEAGWAKQDGRDVVLPEFTKWNTPLKMRLMQAAANTTKPILAKSNAQKCKEYRERQKAKKASAATLDDSVATVSKGVARTPMGNGDREIKKQEVSKTSIGAKKSASKPRHSEPMSSLPSQALRLTRKAASVCRTASLADERLLLKLGLLVAHGGAISIADMHEAIEAVERKIASEKGCKRPIGYLRVCVANTVAKRRLSLDDLLANIMLPKGARLEEAIAESCTGSAQASSWDELAASMLAAAPSR